MRSVLEIIQEKEKDGGEDQSSSSEMVKRFEVGICRYEGQ